jgi:hypothetical protein
MVGSDWPPVSSGRSRLPVSASEMEYREPRSQIERPFLRRESMGKGELNNTVFQDSVAPGEQVVNAAYLLVKKELDER